MKKLLLGVLLFGAIAANAVVYQHAKAMTVFVPAGLRTASPEDLNFVDKLEVLLRGVTLPRPEHQGDPGDHGLSFESLHFANSNGDTLHAWSIPAPASRATVLMFHGYGGNASALLEHAVVLHEMGYSLLLVDFFGAGLSSGSHTTIGVAEAYDVRAAVELARQRWPEQQLVLHGQSMGAAAVLRAVARLGVRADALVLESSYDSLLNTVKVRFRSMGLPDTPFAHWLLFWGGVQHGFDPFDMRPIDDAAAVQVPMLLLQGGDDPRVPIEQFRAFAELRDATHRTELFSAAGHIGMYGSDPQRWRAVVGDFITGLSKEK